MTDQNQKLPENANQKWPDPPWSIPPYVVYTPNPITPGASLSATAWVLSSGGTQASTDFNFQTNQSFYNNSVSQAALLQTTTRASTAYADDTAGNWRVFPAATPRVTNKGYLYEGEARTNSISTSDMTGAVVADGIELTTNGNLALNPLNASQNTVQNGWQWSISGGAGTVTWVAGTTSLTGDGTNAALFGTAGFTTVIGLTYTVTVDVGGTISNLRVGTSAFGTQNLSAATVVGTGQKFQFVATATTTFIAFAHPAATLSTVANISVLSAGKLPNNWIGFPGSGLAINVVGKGVESGLNYLDIRTVGTTTTTLSGATLLSAERPQQIVASYGQTWSLSQFVYLTAGSFTNLGAFVTAIVENGSAGNGIAAHTGTNFQVGAFPLGTNRIQLSATLTNPLAAFINLRLIEINANSGVAIDFTLRYGAPQLELNPSIDSSVASAVVHSGGGGAGYATGDTGTISGGTANTVATYTVTGQTAGVVTSVSVTAGDYTASGFPPNSGSGVATATGGAQPGSGTGLLLDLTPVNQVALGYGMASSPILTTNAAVTRAADTNSPFTITTGAGTTLCTKAIPLGSWTSNAQVITQIDDGGSNNEIILDFLQGFQQAQIHAGGSSIYSQLGAGWTALVSSRLSVSSVSGAQLFSVDGSTVTAGSNSTKPTGMVNLRVGSFPGNLVPFMGYIQRVTVFNIALSQTALNAL